MEQWKDMNDKGRNLGKLLRERRAYHGWTLSDVSSMTGIAMSTLSKVENGHVSPNFDTILKLSHEGRGHDDSVFKGRTRRGPVAAAGHRSVRAALGQCPHFLMRSAGTSA